MGEARVRIDAIKEVAIVAAYQAGVRTLFVAKQFGVSDTTVRNVLRRHGITPDGQPDPLTADQVAEMVRLYTVDELNTHQIAEQMGVGSNATVLRYLKRAGVTMRAMVKRHKLSVAQRRELVERYEEGENFADLQRAYGVSCQVVEDCLKEHGIKARAPGKRLPAWQDAKGRTWFLSSRWERLYAEWMDLEGLEWTYESRCFKLDAEGHVQFTPDFVVMVDGVEEYHEVKGWLHKADIAKVRAFAAQYPQEATRLKLIGPAEMAARGLEAEWYERHSQVALIEDLQGEVIYE
jgi:transposase-like protein